MSNENFSNFINMQLFSDDIPFVQFRELVVAIKYENGYQHILITKSARL